MKQAVRVLAAWVVCGALAVSNAASAQALENQPSADDPTPAPLAELSPPETAQLRSLQLRLDEVASEEAGTSTVLPWTVVVLGVSAVVLGTALGVEQVASCDESCPSPFWPTWVLVAGAGVTTGGIIWLKLVREDIAELRSRRFHLELQIDGYETLREARRDRALLRVGGRF